MEEREMERQFMQTIRRLGRLHLSHMIGEVNRGEFAALAALERWNKRHDGKGANASMLAELVEASPQALSRTLRSLEAKAFIERAADARDRRNVLIYLTDKGGRKRETSDTVRQGSCSNGRGRYAPAALFNEPSGGRGAVCCGRPDCWRPRGSRDGSVQICGKHKGKGEQGCLKY